MNSQQRYEIIMSEKKHLEEYGRLRLKNLMDDFFVGLYLEGRVYGVVR